MGSRIGNAVRNVAGRVATGARNLVARVTGRRRSAGTGSTSGS